MSAAISKITYANNITLITLADLPCDSAVVASVLTAFAQAQVDVDMISQTAPQGGEMRLSFTISDDSLGDALTILGACGRSIPPSSRRCCPATASWASLTPVCSTAPAWRRMCSPPSAGRGFRSN
ncbi:MAG: hypothetical protein LUF84_04045 [Clostridiales bacterium]|nr:hypothetical protein [Clostridiales bacterium]